MSVSSVRIRRPIVVCLSVVLACSAATLASDEGELTPDATTAVTQLFPRGSILDVVQETEAGVAFFEVTVRDGSRRVEVEVTADGNVGEIETEVPLADLPRAVADGIARLAGGATVKHAERHEVRGVPRNGTFAAVEPPVVLYEVSYVDGGVRREITLGEDGKPVPQADDDSDGDDDFEEGEEEEAADLDLG
jgi:hypothetical protein